MRHTHTFCGGLCFNLSSSLCFLFAVIHSPITLHLLRHTCTRRFRDLCPMRKPTPPSSDPPPLYLAPDINLNCNNRQPSNNARSLEAQVSPTMTSCSPRVLKLTQLTNLICTIFDSTNSLFPRAFCVPDRSLLRLSFIFLRKPSLPPAGLYPVHLPGRLTRLTPGLASG